jgi:Flp pilus assembly pilin Flp
VLHGPFRKCRLPVQANKKAGLGGKFMAKILRLWWSVEGQDIAEYGVMLAAILVLVIGTIRLVGGNANNAFSSVASNLQ